MGERGENETTIGYWTRGSVSMTRGSVSMVGVGWGGVEYGRDIRGHALTKGWCSPRFLVAWKTSTSQYTNDIENYRNKRHSLHKL